MRRFVELGVEIFLNHSSSMIQVSNQSTLHMSLVVSFGILGGNIYLGGFISEERLCLEYALWVTVHGDVIRPIGLILGARSRVFYNTG